jgi:hypothetical protein
MFLALPAMFLQSSFLLILPLFALRVVARVDCASLRSFFLPGVVISNAVHLTAGTTFPASADPTCFTPTFVNSVDICRVTGVITTSPTSSVSFEMWLPDTWYGRVLTTGNGGLGGCKLPPFVFRARSQLITNFFFHVQVSDTRPSTKAPLSILPRSGPTTGTTEASTPSPSSYHCTSKPSPIFRTAQYTSLPKMGRRSHHVTMAPCHITRTTTGVRRVEDKGFLLPPGTLKTLTALLPEPPLLIGTISSALLRSGPLTLPTIHPARSLFPSGVRSSPRRFSTNATDLMERWMGSLPTLAFARGTRIPFCAGRITTEPVV